MQKEQINSHVTLFVNDSSNKKEVFYAKGDMSSLFLGVNIKGESKHKSLICDYCGEKKNNHTYIGIQNHFEGLFNIDSDGYKRGIGLFIKKDYLQTLLPKNKFSEDICEFFQSNKSTKNLKAKKNNFKTQSLAQEILNSPHENTLDKLYLEAKTLELIHTEFSSLFNEKQRDPNIIKLSNQDKEAIHYAREILLNNLSNPPSIKELSRMVAINELKLKVGFNRLFNQTPYSVSLEYRLQEAKKLLSQTNDLNISEIAKLVGYKYASNFTQAFYKRFGIKPKELMKSRKYYY